MYDGSQQLQDVPNVPAMVERNRKMPLRQSKKPRWIRPIAEAKRDYQTTTRDCCFIGTDTGQAIMTEADKRKLIRIIRKLANEKYGREAKHLPDREDEYRLLMELAKRMESER